MKLRNIENRTKINDGSRTLLESIVDREVEAATKDWIKRTDSDFVIIGGIALAYHHIPRYTQDLDVLYRQTTIIPDNVEGFKRTCSGAYEHKKTGVEVELVTPGFINVPINIIEKVFDTAIQVGNSKIASKNGLIALKLLAIPGRSTTAKALQDKVDIMSLIETGGIDISEFPLPEDALERFEQIKQEMQTKTR